MELSHCLEHSCPSSKYCFRYHSEEDPNKTYGNFGNELDLTKCPEFIDIKFDDMDEMFMKEECHKESKGVKDEYARRYSKHEEVR